MNFGRGEDPGYEIECSEYFSRNLQGVSELKIGLKLSNGERKMD